MRCAATGSSRDLSLAPRAPAARKSCSASNEVRCSSASSAGMPKRPVSLCAKRRANRPTGCSDPSVRDGTPTTKRIGCHSATIRAMAANRTRLSDPATLERGWASRVSKSPTATPMRRVPKSKARTVPALGRCVMGGGLYVTADPERFFPVTVHYSPIQAWPACSERLAKSMPRSCMAAGSRSSAGTSKMTSDWACTVSHAFCASSCSSWPGAQPA